MKNNTFHILFLVPALLIASLAVSAQEPQYDPLNYSVRYAPQVDISTVPLDGEGYRVLFDGSGTFGWRAYGGSALPEGWCVKEGLLCYFPGQTRENDIVYAYRFKNFILELDWNMSEGGNSGIFILANEVFSKRKNGSFELRDIYINAPEYQLLDDENHPDAHNGATGTHRSGALYDMIPPSEFNAEPYGQWNHTRIVCDGGHVEHWQNGVKVLEYRLWTHKWDKMIDRSKFSKSNWPLANVLMKKIGHDDHRGYIGLQDHGDMVFFRNIRVKILPD